MSWALGQAHWPDWRNPPTSFEETVAGVNSIPAASAVTQQAARPNVWRTDRRTYSWHRGVEARGRSRDRSVLSTPSQQVSTHLHQHVT